MIYVLCPTCHVGMRVSPGEHGEAEDLLGPSSDWYPDKYPCPTCESPCRAYSSVAPEELETYDVRDVTPMEAFVALCGVGFPEEQACGEDAVGKLFGEQKVKRVFTRQVHNSTRCVLECIEFEDGSKAHFGASSHGATIYRISRPGKYADRVE